MTQFCVEEALLEVVDLEERHARSLAAVAEVAGLPAGGQSPADRHAAIMREARGG